MSIIPDSHNGGTFERKTHAERSVRHPATRGPDHLNPKPKITLPVAMHKVIAESATGTTKYPK